MTPVSKVIGFILRERRFLAFGFLLTLISSFGQTFFISLFSEPLRARFELSNFHFGLAYSAATLASGIVILQAGRVVDAFDLRWVTASVLAGLAIAAGLVASAPAIAVLVLGLFGLRLCGQGLCGHIAMTAMARTFDRRRGLAMSVAGAGQAAGEAILPLTAVLLLQHISWRTSWGLIAGVVLLLVLPLAVWLLRGVARDRMRPTPEPTAGAETAAEIGAKADPDDDPPAPATSTPNWTREDVLCDARFWLILPAVLAPGTIITGVFFHQVHLVTVRGWDMGLFAASFIVFSATQVPAGLIGGPLLDRVGATRMLPLALLPMAGGLAVLAGLTTPLAAPLFLGLTGITAGLAGTVVGASWAELYGVRHLGSIRSLAMSASVIGTAISPFAAGWFIDQGIAPSPMIGTAAAAAALASIVAWIALRWRPAGTPPPPTSGIKPVG